MTLETLHKYAFNLGFYLSYPFRLIIAALVTILTVTIEREPDFKTLRTINHGLLHKKSIDIVVQ